MDGMDWSIVIVVIAVTMLSLFFGWTEHVEAMAGCAK